MGTKALAAYAPDVAYKTMSEDTVHILVPLETNALTKGFAQAFNDLLDTIHKTSAVEDDLVLLGEQTGAQIREPVLDDELVAVQSWVLPLKTAIDSTLQAYGDALEP